MIQEKTIFKALQVPLAYQPIDLSVATRSTTAQRTHIEQISLRLPPNSLDVAPCDCATMPTMRLKGIVAEHSALHRMKMERLDYRTTEVSVLLRTDIELVMLPCPAMKRPAGMAHRAVPKGPRDKAAREIFGPTTIKPDP
jgi:hypothetical protein